MAAPHQKNKKTSIAIPLVIAVFALAYFTYQRDSDKPDKPSVESSQTIANKQQPAPGNIGNQRPDSTNINARTYESHNDNQASSEYPPNLPPDMVEALSGPPPELPPDLQAQLDAPPPELPEDLQQQLNSPPPELPPDLQAQLQGPPPELPEDIKKSLQTPPRVVTIDEVNNPS